MDHDPSDYFLELSSAALISVDGEPEDCITEFHIKIEGPDNDKEVGRLHCQFVDANRIFDDGREYFPFLDSHDGDLGLCCKVFKPRLDHSCRLTKAACSALGIDPNEFMLSDNFIHISRLEVLPEHRGKGVGLWTLSQTLLYFERTMNVAFFVMLPSPLRGSEGQVKEGSWADRMKYDQFPKPDQAATSKLRELYGKLGFVLVKGTPLMVRIAHDHY